MEKGQSSGISLNIYRDEEFGNICFVPTEDELKALDINEGDSVDISFSNGKTFTDVPFYSGICDRAGKTILFRYPGKKHFSLGNINDRPLWDEVKCNPKDMVTVSLKERGKYIANEEILLNNFSDERKDYPSDEDFTNFRAMSAGRLRKDFFFRGGSPVDSKFNRAVITDNLLKKNEIGFIINISDDVNRMDSYVNQEDFVSEYTMSLYMKGKVYLMGLSAFLKSAEYSIKSVEALRAMMSQKEKTFIHCTLGKDRTGYICMIIEALAGGTYGEMAEDYMMSYKSLYGVDEDSFPAKYNTIKKVMFDGLLLILTGRNDGTEFNDNETFEEYAADFLKQGGMTAFEIEDVKKYICQQP